MLTNMFNHELLYNIANYTKVDIFATEKQLVYPFPQENIALKASQGKKGMIQSMKGRKRPEAQTFLKSLNSRYEREMFLCTPNNLSLAVKQNCCSKVG